MGALDYLSNFCTITRTRSRRKPMQTVDIRVKMDCDGCERRVKNAVKTIEGVKTVVVNRILNQVTVTGYIKPNKVLKRVKGMGRAQSSGLTSLSNSCTIHMPHKSDKRAPAGYV